MELLLLVPFLWLGVIAWFSSRPEPGRDAALKRRARRDPAHYGTWVNTAMIDNIEDGY